MNTPHPLRLIVCAAACLLAACSGGSDDAPVPGPVTNPPPQEADFTLELSADKAVVMQGQALSLRASVTRSAGFSGAVQVTLAGLPEGVSAQPVLIPAGATQADIVLNALGAAPHSLPTAATAQGVAATAGTTGTASRALTVTVRGPAGAVDTSFAGGAVITPVDIGEDYARAVAVQADGKVVVAGASNTAGGTRLSLVRYLRDGSLDTSFGNGGKVLTAVGTAGNDAAAAIAIQRDGKIVVAGSADLGNGNTDFAVLRYHPDGSLDAGFGDGGKRLVDFAGGGDRAWALLIQDDGKILAGGEASLGSTTTGIDFALLRLTPEGALDAGFGSGGKLTTAIKANAGTDVVRAMALQRVDGSDRILAVGGEGNFLAARYTASGALDTSFAGTGTIAGLFNDVIGAARAVTVLPTGEAVIAGHIGHHFAAVQLTVDGRLDNRFGGNGSGKFEFNVVSGWNEATALVRQADGKFVIGGWAATGNSSSGDFAALRIGADGVLDASFATAGVLIAPTAAGTKNDQSNALTLQADDRVPAVRAIQAGEANGSNNDFALRRLWL